MSHYTNLRFFFDKIQWVIFWKPSEVISVNISSSNMFLLLFVCLMQKRLDLIKNEAWSKRDERKDLLEELKERKQKVRCHSTIV